MVVVTSVEGQGVRVGLDASALAARSGGIRRYTEQLLGALGARGDANQYSLIAPRGARPIPDFGQRFSSEVAGSRLSSLRRQVWLEGDLDLYHGLNYSAPLVGRVPTVLTIHDLTVHLFPELHPRVRRLRHRLLPYLCRRASRLIADSASTRDDLVRCYEVNPRRIDVIHLAADERFRPVTDERERARVRTRYALPEQYVLFVGSIEPRKNLSLLVRAMARIHRQDPKHPLVLVGDPLPGEVRALERLAQEEELELGRDIRFLGWVEDDDLPALYSMSELFVYPSRYEGLGLPPLEAMACGTPVLVADNSSFGELYRDCSGLLDLSGPNLVERAAEAIQGILGSNALRSELVERGLAVGQGRSWQDVAAETLDVYSRAVG